MELAARKTNNSKQIFLSVSVQHRFQHIELTTCIFRQRARGNAIFMGEFYTGKINKS